MSYYGHAQTGIKSMKSGEVKSYKIGKNSNDDIFLPNVCIDIWCSIIVSINYIEKYHFPANNHWFYCESHEHNMWLEPKEGVHLNVTGERWIKKLLCQI